MSNDELTCVSVSLRVPVEGQTGNSQVRSQGPDSGPLVGSRSPMGWSRVRSCASHPRILDSQTKGTRELDTHQLQAEPMCRGGLESILN
jgi:hypothetical protein